MQVYVGEQAMHSSKVYTRLNERLGLSDHLMVLNVVLGKIATNLKVYGAAEEIIHLTLNLFQVGIIISPHCIDSCER
jgi:exportin-7